MAGKPHAGHLRSGGRAKRRALIGRSDRRRRRVLAIGDGMATDVAGARRQGLDMLFIANGIHGGTLKGPDGRLATSRVEAFLAGAGERARFAMADLACGRASRQSPAN